MSISISEFKSDVERYITLAKTEDLYIRLDGEVVMKLTNTKSDRKKIAKLLLGAVPADITLEQSRDIKAEEI